MPIITKPLAKILSGEVLAALEAVAQKHGLRVSVEGSRFNETQYTPKVVFQALSESGAPVRFALEAQMLGIAPDCWNKKIMAKGEWFTITGLDLGRPTFPVNMKRDRDGTGFRFTKDAVCAVYPGQKP